MCNNTITITVCSSCVHSHSTNRTEFGYVDALDAEVSVATGSCADAFVHDAEGHTLAVRAPWLAHVMGAAFAALAAARRAGTEAGPEALDRASRAVALLCGECETA